MVSDLRAESVLISTAYFSADDRGALRVLLAQSPAREAGQQAAINLEIIGTAQFGEGAVIVDYASQIDGVRKRMQYQFEAMITDRARAQFGARDA